MYCSKIHFINLRLHCATYCLVGEARTAGVCRSQQWEMWGNHQLCRNSLAAKTSTKPTGFDLIKISKSEIRDNKTKQNCTNAPMFET